jgi:hypothetical protein
VQLAASVATTVYIVLAQRLVIKELETIFAEGDIDSVLNGDVVNVTEPLQGELH